MLKRIMKVSNLLKLEVSSKQLLWESMENHRLRKDDYSQFQLSFMLTDLMMSYIRIN